MDGVLARHGRHRLPEGTVEVPQEVRCCRGRQLEAKGPKHGELHVNDFVLRVSLVRHVDKVRHLRSSLIHLLELGRNQQCGGANQLQPIPLDLADAEEAVEDLNSQEQGLLSVLELPVDVDDPIVEDCPHLGVDVRLAFHVVWPRGTLRLSLAHMPHLTKAILCEQNVLWQLGGGFLLFGDLCVLPLRLCFCLGLGLGLGNRLGLRLLRVHRVHPGLRRLDLGLALSLALGLGLGLCFLLHAMIRDVLHRDPPRSGAEQGSAGRRDGGEGRRRGDSGGGLVPGCQARLLRLPDSRIRDVAERRAERRLLRSAKPALPPCACL
mmetsp:Transcript_83748/g.211206  ORF Transcript_83748/g.211206 Transcript_83748/m.211206 type:complete len:322 (-) Transcript_83748:667-1632(-)